MRYSFVAVLTFLSLANSQEFVNASQVAYIYSDSDTGNRVDYLTGYGNTVSYFNNPTGLTLGSLSGFDAILVSSNLTFTEAANIALVAKQFADSGGGVVLSQFDFQGHWALSNGIMDAGYSPFSVDPNSDGYGFISYLGTVYSPSSPILNGVDTSSVSTQFQANVGLDPGATLVADWTSGRLAIAYNVVGSIKVVGLNLFPSSFFSTDINTQRVVANAIQFSVNQVPEPSAIVLCGIGMAAIVLMRNRQKVH